MGVHGVVVVDRGSRKGTVVGRRWRQGQWRARNGQSQVLSEYRLSISFRGQAMETSFFIF
jgi:hypothetical protein